MSYITIVLFNWSAPAKLRIYRHANSRVLKMDQRPLPGPRGQRRLLSADHSPRMAPFQRRDLSSRKVSSDEVLAGWDVEVAPAGGGRWGGLEGCLLWPCGCAAHTSTLKGAALGSHSSVMNEGCQRGRAEVDWSTVSLYCGSIRTSTQTLKCNCIQDRLRLGEFSSAIQI